jgi:hypothetical protein
MRHREKIYPTCPDCNGPMSSHALLCRGCYLRVGGIRALIYQAALLRGESSPRSRVKPEETPKRAATLTNQYDNGVGLSVEGAR